MKRHIKIITDGSCDLPKEVIERVNPGIIGINVCFGEEIGRASCRERV